MSQVNTNPIERTESTRRPGSLLDDLGWGVLLIVTGILWLVPSGEVPSGTWLMAAGFIILVFNVARYMHQLPASGFGIAAGVIALLAGAGAALDVSLPLIPVALIVVGGCMFLASEREHHLPKGQDQHCC